MARAYLKFTRKGEFVYNGGCAVDVDDPTDMKEIWMKANDFMFTEFVVKERDYDNDEWSFELLEIEEAAVAND